MEGPSPAPPMVAALLPQELVSDPLPYANVPWKAMAQKHRLLSMPFRRTCAAMLFLLGPQLAHMRHRGGVEGPVARVEGPVASICCKCQGSPEAVS